MHPTGSFDFLIAATRNEGPLYMEIDGEPFATGEDLEGPIGAAMEQAVQTRVLRLTTELDAAEDPAFRLVLVFNPPDSGALMAFCRNRSEEHTSELQSLMRISYAVFCLKKKKATT